MSLWRSKAFGLEPGHDWEMVGQLATVNTSILDRIANGQTFDLHAAIITPAYTGGFIGDPRGGATRILTRKLSPSTQLHFVP